jgi:hypothetical protein
MGYAIDQLKSPAKADGDIDVGDGLRDKAYLVSKVDYIST